MIPDAKPQRTQAAGLPTRDGVSDLAKRECSAMNVLLFTRDDQALIIEHIVGEVMKFKATFDSDKLRFGLASGHVGVMAATNEAVEAAVKRVNLALFASVGPLCLITFRFSLREGFLETLQQRGTASLFAAVTMTIGVAIWVLSTLKFQADMGVLPGFIFMVNGGGAILLASRLAAFLVCNRHGARKLKLKPVGA